MLSLILHQFFYSLDATWLGIWSASFSCLHFCVPSTSGGTGTRDCPFIHEAHHKCYWFSLHSLPPIREANIDFLTSKRNSSWVEVQQKSAVGIKLEHLSIALTAVLSLVLDTPETIARWPVSITNDGAGWGCGQGILSPWSSQGCFQCPEPFYLFLSHVGRVASDPVLRCSSCHPLPTFLLAPLVTPCACGHKHQKSSLMFQGKKFPWASWVINGATST